MTEEYTSSTHPPLPPTTEDIRYSWLRLLRSRRVGSVTFHRLIAEYGSAQNALDALPKVARNAGVKGYKICPVPVVDAEIKAAKAAKARLLCLGDVAYPSQLAALKDAPPLLWTRGDLRLLEKPIIALVGARNASSLGIRMARALARELGAQGYIVVSGLARGIDTAAHLAALNSGTIAVMAGGVDVVEAAAKSGSLITARDALDQGREVLAVPGHPFDARASGCNMLIQDGAQLVRNAEDVIAALPTGLGPAPAAQQQLQPDEPPPPQQRSLRETAALHQEILSRLGPSPTAEDQLIRDLSAATRDVSPALTELELEGEIIRQPGGMLSRGPGR